MKTHIRKWRAERDGNFWKTAGATKPCGPYTDEDRRSVKCLAYGDQ